MNHEPRSLVQVDFSSPEGRRERVWAECISSDHARILNVPVWAYGVSIGSVVHIDSEHTRLLRESSGATLRFLVNERMSGKHVYLTRVLVDMRIRACGVGPATFFGPRMVAMHVHKRADWWPKVGTYLDELVGEGLVEEWEAGDPDQGMDQEPPTELEVHDILIHPLPVDASTNAEFS